MRYFRSGAPRLVNGLTTRPCVLYLFSSAELTYAIAYALRRIPLPNRRTLSEAERYQIAETAVSKLREHGDPWGLDTGMLLFFHGPPTQGYNGNRLTPCALAPRDHRPQARGARCPAFFAGEFDDSERELTE